MPKMKTSKTAKKRFKKTGSGQLRREQAMRQHLLRRSRRPARAALPAIATCTRPT